MRKKIITQILGVLVLVTSGVAFGQTQIPNTFQSGQPARASEVNDNFSTLESAVNTNTTDISAVAAITIPRVKANGQDIGALVTGSAFADLYGVLSNTGYSFEVVAVDTDNYVVHHVAGEIKRWILKYATANCTGPAYILTTDSTVLHGFGMGYVIASQNLDDQSIYYSPKGNTVLPDTVTLSRTHIAGAGCTTEPTPLTQDVIEVFPNDSGVTGVPLQFFTPPITFDVQTFQVSPP